MNAALQQQLTQILHQTPIMPVLAIDDLDNAIPLAKALVAGGLPVLEITLRTPAALGAMARIAEHVPEAIVGAGTVLNAAQYAQVIAAGARFAISPGISQELLQVSSQGAIPLLPGVATASEVMQGLNAGLTNFKFFPAEAAGGVAMLKSFAGPFAAAKFCPTGGIDPINAPNYLKLGNVMTVGGSWMATAALIGAKDWPAITKLAHSCCALRV
jgi:2-dehydro-3-deoxyphosphogluconate aldolase / (4S)-4-hydroxy-2-oxoglutarate aldolase